MKIFSILKIIINPKLIGYIISKVDIRWQEKFSYNFKINGEECFFGDIPITASTERQIIVYKVVAGSNVTVITNAGTVDVVNGKLTLHSFQPDDTSVIRLTVTPNSLDLAPKRDQLLSIEDLRVTITPEIDTIAVSGSTGSINYTTTSRFK